MANEDERQTISRLAEEVLPVLISRLAASGLGELEVRQDGWRVRLRRPVNGAEPASTRPPRSPSRKPERRGDSGSAQSDQQPDGGSRREHGRVPITSPAVGYYQPREGLAVGTSVRGGDLLGHVDVLGVKRDVVVPQDGIIAAHTAQPGEAVEYGQPLARLEPEGRR